ncbi:HD domain-containing protein [Flavobacterium aurantiibacter]|uniref:Phosphohydrolase n=1 Tax=Flavobacterium aurantiibacter TaxID=2023067 RepID=A0A255ZQ91_9FLAO|nr:HD domain-containing protein [Flavobacterium aurantiibacter]OYQ43045.1 phosphohydrolase [Flavobacterium aurantiibacter]
MSDSSNKLKIFNDPIYGFISIPNPLIFDVIAHKYFQRLRRISQMGLSYLVYPGAHHTRFHHALGAMHLMQKAVRVLRFKGVEISPEEEQALYLAILLHDIGHGPFSHAMEQSIVKGVHHESLSLKFMHALNGVFDGKLDLAIRIFTGNYERKFMLQLISGQLDMDRMDYLRRDSFYTGVAEGSINADRLIQMMDVVDDRLVVEEKGIYSVEKFLVARRLMYWQAYLHKTSYVAELMLQQIFKRAVQVIGEGFNLQASEPLLHFLKNGAAAEFDEADLELFSKLDDTDVLMALKQWQSCGDFVLEQLCERILNRNLLKISLGDEKFTAADKEQAIAEVAEKYQISKAEASYFVYKGKIKNQAYSMDKEPICILKKDKTIADVVFVSDQLNLKALSKPVVKYYLCKPKLL